MKVFPLSRLSYFNPNQSFIWDNRIFTVIQHTSGMTEVVSDGKYFAWPSSSKVTPVIL